jgi:hypothetical protein
LANLASLFTRHRQALAWVLLAVSFAIGLLVLPHGEFVDEGDNLVGGELMLRGYALYADAFTHHFPFPYYWVAAVVGFFGKSIWIVRLSVLAFQILAFGLGMQLSKQHLTGGAAALLWSLLRPFYMGNMVLYTTFSSAALVPVCLITLAVLLDRLQPDWRHWTAVGAFSLVAFWSDPQAIYPIAVTLLFLAWKRIAWGLKVGFVFAGGSAAYLLLLFFGGTFQAFWENAIVFNTEVYSRYIFTKTLRVDELILLAVRGLEVWDPIWFNFSPLRPITNEYTQFDRWIFTGFLFRFSVLAAAAWLALNKRFRPALFLYLFAAAALIIHKWGFRSQPFVLVSLLAMIGIITAEWWQSETKMPLKWLHIMVSVILGLMVIILSGRLGLHIDRAYSGSYRNPPFITLKEEAAYLKTITCQDPEVRLAHYPVGNYYYWFSEMKPVGKYIYMWPWVADVGLPEVIAELDHPHMLAVVVRQDMLIWERYDTREYLRELDELLEWKYIELSPGVYVSPALFRLCPPTEMSSPASLALP